MEQALQAMADNTTNRASTIHRKNISNRQVHLQWMNRICRSKKTQLRYGRK